MKLPILSLPASNLPTPLAVDCWPGCPHPLLSPLPPHIPVYVSLQVGSPGMLELELDT
jgi:hypothetical protein